MPGVGNHDRLAQPGDFHGQPRDGRRGFGHGSKLAFALDADLVQFGIDLREPCPGPVEQLGAAHLFDLDRVAALREFGGELAQAFERGALLAHGGVLRCGGVVGDIEIEGERGDFRFQPLDVELAFEQPVNLGVGRVETHAARGEHVALPRDQHRARRELRRQRQRLGRVGDGINLIQPFAQHPQHLGLRRRDMVDQGYRSAGRRIATFAGGRARTVDRQLAGR